METVEGRLQSADGYWRVEVVRYGRTDRWYRIIHAHTVVAERASIATVQRILGDAFPTLSPAHEDTDNGAA